MTAEGVRLADRINRHDRSLLVEIGDPGAEYLHKASVGRYVQKSRTRLLCSNRRRRQGNVDRNNDLLILPRRTGGSAYYKLGGNLICFDLSTSDAVLSSVFFLL